MKLLSTLGLALVASCAGPFESSTSEAVPPAPKPWDAPSEAGSVLVGVVTLPDGTPLADVQVKTYAGFATRFGTGRAVTDAEGRYRFDPVEGSRVGNGDGTYAWYVGVCVGSVSSVNPPEFLPWTDLRIPMEAGHVARHDVVFDPASVPEHAR